MLLANVIAGSIALVPLLWFYEVGNGLLMACRRKRISLDQVEGFLTRLKALPIEAAQQASFYQYRTLTCLEPALQQV